MLYLAIGFDIIYGFSLTIMMYWTSGFDKYGKCNSYTNWPNATSERVNATTQLFMIYIVVLVVFFYCYGRILHTMRKKKTNVAPKHIQVTSQMTSNAPSQRERTKGGQANVIKTMLLVSTVYGITTAPALFGSFILAFDKMNEFSEWNVGVLRGDGPGHRQHHSRSVHLRVQSGLRPEEVDNDALLLEKDSGTVRLNSDHACHRMACT